MGQPNSIGLINKIKAMREEINALKKENAILRGEEVEEKEIVEEENNNPIDNA